MNIQSALNAFAGLGATWILWLLVGLSVLGLMVVLERSSYLLSTRDRLERVRPELLAHLSGRDLEAGLLKVKKRLDESPSAEARIASAGMAARTLAEAEERMAGELTLQRVRLEQNLSLLGTLGNNAPFVGLLGTVIAVIGAFQELDVAAGRVSAGLMAEVGEALIATAVGLLVALPAVAAFNALNRVIQVRLARGQAFGRELLVARFARTSNDAE